MKESWLRTAFLAAFLTTTVVWGGAVTRDEAFGAATSCLPGFFAGPWRPAGELALYNLSGDTVAYAFIFAGPELPAGPQGQDEAPAAFVAKQRDRLATAGKAVSGDAPELYGADRFATIFISADDTEPPVLRCFLGLPAQIVKESDALALAAKGKDGGAWRVRRCLMLGLFDEALAVDTGSPTAAALVVDLRTGSVVTHEQAQQRARARKHAAPDPERAKQCQKAWHPYRRTGTATAGAKQQQHDAARPPKGLRRDEPTSEPLLPAPQGQ